MQAQIEISNLFLQYASNIVLEDINLSIGQGEFISIVGPNGAGKSSLIKIILGLLEATSGEISIDRKKPQVLDKYYFGYVPQLKTTDHSFPALAIELVASGIRANWIARLNSKLKEQSLEALGYVNSEHLAYKPIKNLSGGELQRIYLARSIARHPKILLLDEPASGIDVNSENDLNLILDSIRDKTDTTIVMVTHDWESAYHHSDRVALLNRKLVCFDIPEKAFSDQALRTTFGHEGHKHKMIFGARHDG